MPSIGDIELTCPNCGEKLPPVKIATRAERVGIGLNINLTPQFDDAWKQQLYDTHGECLQATG